jgi:cyclic-di-AMP phosphodiesterase PgpH
MARDRSISILWLLGAFVVFSAALFAALLPITPGGVRVSEGQIATRTIRAPTEISFESATLTEQRRQEAAAAVPNSLIYDPSVAVTQQAALNDTLGRINAIREDATLSATAKIAALSQVPRLSLSQTSANVLVTMIEERYRQVDSEARRALGTILDTSLPQNQITDIRERATSYVDPALDREAATLIADIIRPFIVPNLTVDPGRTEAARQAARASVAPVRVQFAQNQVIVERDTPITAEAREALLEAGLVSEGWSADILGSAAIMSLLGGAAAVAGMWAFRPAIFAHPRLLLAMLLALAGPVFAMKLYLPFILPDDDRHFLAYMMPLAGAAMVICGLIGLELALIVAIVTAMLAAYAAVYLADLTVVGLAGALEVLRLGLAFAFAGAAAVFAVRSADRFSYFLFGGMAAALSIMAVLTATWLLDARREANDFAWMAAAAGANGGLSAFLSAGMFVTLGSVFGVTTRIQLLEMSQLSQPLLRRMQDEAAATFQHSVIVANLAEKAAYVIGADSLLARVGCYYHDIGKLMRPGFFIENQFGGANPHDALDPLDSARIIRDHVTDGLTLARQYGLPARVAAFVPEHHGTRLITYFYRRAFEEDSSVSPEAFRYPGPKPQSRETAIAMLADSCEAVVRASPDHSPERISDLIEEVFAERLGEGQLDDSDLTLRNVRAIALSFKETLRAVYHPRVEYPAPTDVEMRMRRLPLPRLLDRRS